jgi:hypothetical protein
MHPDQSVTGPLVGKRSYPGRSLVGYGQARKVPRPVEFKCYRAAGSVLAGIGAHSARQRAYEGDRRREFDAHEILAFALAFDLPLIWFFLPPPRDHRNLHHTTNIVSELYGIVFGQESQLGPVYDRLRQLGIDEPTEVDRTIGNLTGKPSRARQTSYLQRRKEMLLALLDQYTDEVDRAADEIGTFFDHLRQVGVRGFVAEQLDDTDYHNPPAARAKRQGRA